MELREEGRYAALGLDFQAVEKLARLGDLLLEARSNVSGIREPAAIERFHILDSLSLLHVPEIREAGSIVDLGSGAGLPALVLAIASPKTEIIAVESIGKKCSFIADSASSLGLPNVEVECRRAEEVGWGRWREAADAVTARALAPFAVILEYGLPLTRTGGLLVAMKGALSDHERIPAERAAAILGGGPIKGQRAHPFEGAENRWLYLVEKQRGTPGRYPRRVGTPQKHPLGGEVSRS